MIAGGYGVFGRLLTAELLKTTRAQVVIAGRDLATAEAACRDWNVWSSGRVEPMRVDLARSGELLRAAQGCVAVACTAGPYQTLSTELVAEVVEAGAHWVDIADARGWVLGLLADRQLHERARAAGVAVGPGLSTLPALSGVLARSLLERVPQAQTATVVLSIGNRNRKGAAAIASALLGGNAGPLSSENTLGSARRVPDRRPGRSAHRQRAVGDDVPGRAGVAARRSHLGACRESTCATQRGRGDTTGASPFVRVFPMEPRGIRRLRPGRGTRRARVWSGGRVCRIGSAAGDPSGCDRAAAAIGEARPVPGGHSADRLDADRRVDRRAPS